MTTPNTYTITYEYVYTQRLACEYRPLACANRPLTCEDRNLSCEIHSISLTVYFCFMSFMLPQQYIILPLPDRILFSKHSPLPIEVYLPI